MQVAQPPPAQSSPQAIPGASGSVCPPPAPQQGCLLPALCLQEGLVPVILHQAAGGERGGRRERAGAKVGPPAARPAGLPGAPGSQARWGGSGRAAEPTTTPQPGWRERGVLCVCFLPDFLSWRCILCWEEMPPSRPTVPPSPAPTTVKSQATCPACLPW